MTWAADQVFAVYHTPHTVDVSSRAWTSQTVLEMPAADVRAGNDYAFILTGALGSFRPLPLGDGACEIALQIGGGQLYDNSRHRQDMSVREYQPAGGGWGHPFMTMVVVPSATAADYRFVFRADGGDATIDAPCLQVWDLTELGAGALTANLTTPTQLTTTPQRLLQGPSLAANTNWLVYWSVDIKQQAWKEGPQVIPPVGAHWLTKFGTDNQDANFTRQYLNANGLQSSHIGYGPRASTKARLDRRYTRMRLGDWAVLNDVSTMTPSVWAASLLGIGQTGFTVTHDATQRVDMVCINLDAGAKSVETQRVQSSTFLFPGEKDDLIGSRGEPRSLVRAFTAADPMPQASSAVLGTVRAGTFGQGITRGIQTTANFALDIDGGKINPRGWVADDGPKGLERTLYTLLRDSAECIPTHRVLSPQLDAGRHCYRWYGRHNAPSSGRIPWWPSFYDATWLQLIGRDAFVVTAPILETAGPDVIVSIRRESATNLASLPQLPAGYSGRVDFEGVDPAIDFRGETGYLHRLPRFAHPRRPVVIRYQALELSELQAIETFLRDLKTTHGSFRFQPPDTETEAAYVLDVSQGWSVSRVGVRFSLSLRAIELVYTA